MAYPMRIFIITPGHRVRDAAHLARRLRRCGILVDHYDPARPWPDPVGATMQQIECADVIISLVSPTDSSEWLVAEAAVAKRQAAPMIRVNSWFPALLVKVVCGAAFKRFVEAARRISHCCYGLSWATFSVGVLLLWGPSKVVGGTHLALVALAFGSALLITLGSLFAVENEDTEYQLALAELEESYGRLAEYSESSRINMLKQSEELATGVAHMRMSTKRILDNLGLFLIGNLVAGVAHLTWVALVQR